ncbi:flavin reductase family protein [Arthrobacter sulfonylureivorans]|uniref:flavin reductase family protein n=1 Tax=Arthrobacter sulfonylureivorans TaxID=2486855 RepID=UPI0039E3982D
MDTAVQQRNSTNDVLSADHFKRAFRNHPAGVAVITADPGDGPVALTATSVISISAAPPILAFSLSSTSSASAAILKAETVVIHLLTAHDLPIAQLCSTSGLDRFADLTLWRRLSTGEPIFHSVVNRIRGRIANTVDAGGSTIVAVEALESSVTEAPAAVSPLIYHDRTWHHLGRHSVL